MTSPSDTPAAVCAAENSGWTGNRCTAAAKDGTPYCRRHAKMYGRQPTAASPARDGAGTTTTCPACGHSAHPDGICDEELDPHNATGRTCCDCEPLTSRDPLPDGERTAPRPEPAKVWCRDGHHVFGLLSYVCFCGQIDDSAERTAPETPHDFPSQEERTGMRVGMPKCRTCGVIYGSIEARKPCAASAPSAVRVPARAPEEAAVPTTQQEQLHQSKTEKNQLESSATRDATGAQ